MFSDAEETPGTGTDTVSSWFLSRCRFGAGPSVITKSSTHNGPSKNLSPLVCLCECMFVTSVCAHLRVDGERLGVCISDLDVCVE